MRGMTRFVSLAAALPGAILALAGLWWTLGAAWSGGLWPPDEVTLPEAVATRNAGEVLRLIGLGTDPNSRALVRPEVGLGNDEPVNLTGPEAAVWVRDPAMVRLLEQNGALFDRETVTVLRCLNDARPDAGVREELETISHDPWPSCGGIRLPGTQRE